MNVGKLIKELSKLDSDAIVVMPDGLEVVRVVVYKTVVVLSDTEEEES